MPSSGYTPKVVLGPGERGPDPLPVNSLERLLERVMLNEMRAMLGRPPMPGWPVTREEAYAMAGVPYPGPLPEPTPEETLKRLLTRVSLNRSFVSWGKPPVEDWPVTEEQAYAMAGVPYPLPVGPSPEAALAPEPAPATSQPAPQAPQEAPAGVEGPAGAAPAPAPAPPPVGTAPALEQAEIVTSGGKPKTLTPERIAHLQRLRGASPTGLICDECERALPMGDHVPADDQVSYTWTKVADVWWSGTICGRCVRGGEVEDDEQEEEDEDDGEEITLGGDNDPILEDDDQLGPDDEIDGP